MRRRKVIAPVEPVNPDNLFVGVYPAGLVYCDKSKTVDGDYQLVAFLSFATLELTIHAQWSPLLPLARGKAAEVQARRGQEYRTSACGQTILLGYAL